jgi:hypothetical protein
MSLVCVIVGAVVGRWTASLAIGVAVTAGCLLVLDPLLSMYEKKQRTKAEGPVR